MQSPRLDSWEFSSVVVEIYSTSLELLCKGDQSGKFSKNNLWKHFLLDVELNFREEKVVGNETKLVLINSEYKRAKRMEIKKKKLMEKVYRPIVHKIKRRRKKCSSKKSEKVLPTKDFLKIQLTIKWAKKNLLNLNRYNKAFTETAIIIRRALIWNWL